MEKDFLHEQAQARLKDYSELIEKIESFLKTSSRDKIWCKKRNNSFQYYKIDHTKNDARIYIRKKNIAIARNAVQAEYYTKLLSILKNNYKALESFSSHYDFLELINVYKKMPLAKQVLINPVYINDTLFAEKWQAKDYERKNEQPEGNLITLKNEKVRSKSEVIIANMLNTKGIPYHYEYPVQIRADVIFHPDFLCLNKRTRQEFYWEHCGKMDDIEYSSNLVKRLSDYSQKNILPGKNLILTMETSDHPLNTKDVEKVINSYLI